jgi:hypothetical protein
VPCDEHVQQRTTRVQHHRVNVGQWGSTSSYDGSSATHTGSDASATCTTTTTTTTTTATTTPAAIHPYG